MTNIFISVYGKKCPKIENTELNISTASEHQMLSFLFVIYLKITLLCDYCCNFFLFLLNICSVHALNELDNNSVVICNRHENRYQNRMFFMHVCDVCKCACVRDQNRMFFIHVCVV